MCPDLSFLGDLYAQNYDPCGQRRVPSRIHTFTDPLL